MREHPLERAAALARATPVEARDWDRTAAVVMRHIRTTVRPGRPVRAVLSDDRGSSTAVNERVVVAGLRRALAAVGPVAPAAIRLAVEGDLCTAVELDLVADYGHDLLALGDTCWASARVVLQDLLLEGADAIDVRLTVVDVSV